MSGTTSEVDRSVPVWPEVREDGIIPSGFGAKDGGNQSCFCTRYNGCWVYVPHSLTISAEEARAILESALPTLVWPDPGGRWIDVVIEGHVTAVFLKRAFNHILAVTRP